MTILTREKTVKILLWVIKLSVFFILFLPLVMKSNFFFPFIVVKNVLFRITVETVFVAYLILAHLDRSYRPRFNKITIAVIAFFVISLIAALVGINFYNSFWGNYERMSGIFHHFHLVLYFFVLVNTVRTKKEWYSFFTLSIFASVLMSLLGLSQWLGVSFLLRSSGSTRLTGTVGNPTFFAAYLIFNLFFILYFLAREKRFDLKLFSSCFLAFDIFLVLGAILNQIFASSNFGIFNFLKIPILSLSLGYPSLFYPFLIFQILILAVWLLRSKKNVIRVLLSIIFIFEFFIFFNTQTRGALVGFAAGITFLFLISLFLKVSKKFKIIGLIFLFIILISPFVLVKNKNSDFVENNPTLYRLATISTGDLTTESRLLTWNASWQGWKENLKTFLIGYGPENYYYVFNKYFPVKIYKDSGSRIWFDRAHDIIFDVGVTTGVLGLISYFAILTFAALSLFKKYKENKSIISSWLLISLIIAYFFQNIFVFDTLNTEIPFYLFLAFVVFLAGNPKGESEETVVEEKKDINYIYISILVVVLLFGVLAINVRTLKANNYLFKGLTTSDGYQVTFEYFKKSINEAVTGKYEARQQLATFANGVARDKNISLADAKEIVDYAEEELKKSIEEEPLNVRHYLYLATFYNATTNLNRNNPQKVINLLEDAIDLSPTRPHTYYEIAQAYAFMNNFEESYEYFQRGVKLAPRVIDDQWNLLTISIVFERYNLVEERLQFMREELHWRPEAADYRRLIDLYGRVKNFPKMIEFQEEVVSLEPSAEEYAKLAALYAKIGANQQAKEATQKALELNPDFSAEAEIFLDKLNKGELLEK